MNLAPSVSRLRPAHLAFLAFALFGLIFALPGLATIAAPALNQTGADVPPAGDIIVVLRDDIITASADNVAAASGVDVELEYTNVFRGFATTATQSEINDLAANPNVAFIDKVYPVEAADQIEAAGQSPSTAVTRSAIAQFSQINGDGANTNVDIAILDTGVGPHDDINIVNRQDFTGSGTVNDVDGHGTHVAGIAAAKDNGGGVAGAAPGARIHSVKVLKSSGVGLSSWLIAGLDYVVSRGDIEVVNMSIAGERTGYSACGSTQDTVHLAICRAHNRGILLVAAAGNSGTDASGTFPAKYPEVLAVANVADYDGRGGNDSLNPSSNYGGVVQIAAPGTNIFSTLPGNNFGIKTGTSMASPLVAGIGAMYRATTGASEGSTRSWLLYTASRSQSSSVGWSPPAPTGSPNRMLYLGGLRSSYPPGVKNPSFYGAKTRITNSYDYPYTGTSSRAYDGSNWSNWSAPHNTPSYAKITFDMGSDKNLTGVKWRYLYLGYADEFIVRVYNSQGGWRDLGKFGNATAAQTWFGVPTVGPVTVRFVEFIFLNPDRDVTVGSLSEVELWVDPHPGFAATADPDLQGEALPIACEANPATGEEGHNADKACDRNGGTNWHTDPTTPEKATLTVKLDQPTLLSGVKWNFAQSGNAELFDITVKNGERSRSMGTFSGGPANTYQGLPFTDEVIADTVELTFTNVDQDLELGYLAEVEVWGERQSQASPEASPGASPAASPVASPSASPEASPVASPTVQASPVPAGPTASPEIPVASPVASPGVHGNDIPSETPIATPPAAVTAATPQPAGTVVPSATATPGPATPLPVETVEVATPTGFAEPTATVEPTATETEQPAATETIEPTATASKEITPGTITGTDGDSVNCRTAPVDGEVIGSLNEGDQVDVVGGEVNGWYHVTCHGQPGFVSADFITLGEVPTTEEPEAGEGSSSATVVPTDEATEEVTEEPVTTPYPILDTGDTENSGTAWNASDNDPSTVWSVIPTQSPEQVRLYFDLGSVMPIDHLTLELSQSGLIPVFEIWLSEDAAIWYNATPGGINGWDLGADEAHVITLGFDARYIRLVIPAVDQQISGEVGGIRQIDVWPGDIDQTQYLTTLGQPTTPTPEPEPTEEVAPTAEPTEDLVPTSGTVEEIAPTEEVTNEGFPTEAATVDGDSGEQLPPVDGSDDGQPVAPNG